ncbi:MAG: hypothetical protein JST16_19105 [Bdellovibrionales bacterium]|nr:hypothetical protein [Bdellovibrionales bacterium]
MLRYFVYFICLTLGACGGGDFPSYQKLSGLRVLALKADHPEVAPGATVKITPLLSAIGLSGETITQSAEACSDPGLAVNADPNCDRATDRVVVLPSTTVAFSSAGRTQAFADALTVNVPATATGVYFVSYTLKSSGGSEVKGFKRIVVTTTPSGVTNPTLTDLHADGTTLAAYPDAGPVLVPVFPAGVDTSSWEVTWLLSDGKFEKSRTLGVDTNTVKTNASDATLPRVVTVVVRNAAGGVDYKIFEF